jgi:hypothetical protein
VDVLPYDDHDRAVKPLHSLDRTIWGGKCWGVTRKIRMTALTRVRVFDTFKFKVRAQRDRDSLCK